MPTMPVLLLCGGAIALYVCARAFIDAQGQASGAGRRAIVMWLPVMFTAVAFAQRGMVLEAIGMVFAVSVAVLGLAQGLLLALGTAQGQRALSPEHRRLWMLPLPVVLLYLVAGFGGRFSGWMALFLLVQGLPVLLVFLERLRAAAASEPPTLPVPRGQRVAQFAQVALALLLGIVGALLAVAGTIEIEHTPSSAMGIHGTLSAGFTAATLVAPLLVLAVIGSGMGEMGHGRLELTTTTHTAIALLNLCLLIPALILAWYLHPDRLGLLFSLENPLDLLPFPPGMWRVDVVVLVVVALAMWPAAMGRWVFSRLEGIFLVTLYIGYLLLLTLSGARS